MSPLELEMLGKFIGQVLRNQKEIMQSLYSNNLGNRNDLERRMKETIALLEEHESP